jgi:hypothetical protein
VILLVPLIVVTAVLALRGLRGRLAGDADAVLAGPATWSRAVARPVPDRARAIALLARREARYVLTHPSILVGLLLAVVFVGSAASTSDASERYLIVTGSSAPGLYLPTLTFFAANLCASRPRRARAGELFDATPASAADRTLAQCLAALGPVLVAVGIVAVAFAAFAVTEPALPATPPLWALFSLPLAVLGAGTLGVMVARWLPFRGAALAVMVALVLATAYLSAAHPMLSPVGDFLDYTDDETYVLVPRPAGLHAAYLLGLDTMALIGALLAHAGRRRLLLGLGAVATGVTAWAGAMVW